MTDPTNPQPDAAKPTEKFADPATTEADRAAIAKAAAERQVAEHEAAIARLKLERAKDEREVLKLVQPLAAEEAAAQEVALERLKLERATAERETAKLAQAATEEAAKQETTLARLKLERATAERDLVRLARPWWRSWNITALGAFLAAVAPATAGVTGYYQKQTQLALEAQKQQHEIAMAEQKQDEDIGNRYLDRLADPYQRRRTLRWLTATSSKLKIREWAEKEGPFLTEQETAIQQQHGRLIKQVDEDEKATTRHA